jgi:hypothetical protein
MCPLGPSQRPRASSGLAEQSRERDRLGPQIGIGAPGVYPGDPSHTTRQAGPHRAVRRVEVTTRPEGSGDSSPSPSGRSLLSARCRSPPSTLPRSEGPSGLHPCFPTGAPVAWTSEAWRLRDSRLFCSPLRSVLRCCRQLLRPLLTSRSAAQATSPFQARGEISPGKSALLPHTTAGFTPLPVGHESFAVSCPLALVGGALYPVSVRRPMGYLPRFLQTVGHPSALALPFGPCGQVPGGLAPPGVRPCRAHKRNGGDPGASAVAQSV